MNVKRTVSFSKNSTNVFFHILTRCNLKCRHCYVNPSQHGKDALSLSTMEACLNAFSENGQSVNVVFLGGEPTLHPELSSAIKLARKLGYGSVTVDTNGYLFNDILDKVSPEEVDYFSFSLDGPDAETNDPIRGKGSFDACTAGIRKAVSKGFRASSIYTVSAENIGQLERMPHLLEKLGVERFFIQVIGLRGKSAKTEEKPGEKLQVSREQWLSVVPRAAERAAERGIVVTYPKVYLEDGETFECAGVVADNYFIFPNGRVYRCPLCEDYPVHGLEFADGRLNDRPRLNETDLFRLDIPEGCVMNKIVQPDNIPYDENGNPECRVACCMLKEEVRPV